MVRVLGVGAVACLSLVASGCALYATPHGRVRVGVSVPLPVPVIRVPVYGASHPVPAPAPAPAPQAYPPSSYPAPSHPPASYPPSGHGGAYPSAGYVSHAQAGVVRSVESLGPRGHDNGLRVTVMLDDQSLRSFHVPWSDWRVGDRVRVDGGRLLRG